MKLSTRYDEVGLQKFVYDKDNGSFRITDEPMTYFDTPYHSHLIEELYDQDNSYDHDFVEGYLLLEDGDNAIDHNHTEEGTIVARTDLIPDIVNAFRANGERVNAWYNTRTGESTPLAQGKLSYDEYDDEDDYDNKDFDSVDTMKFVHDPNHDVTQIGPHTQQYYDHPHHSELMEQLADNVPGHDWELGDIHSGYLYLEPSPRDAMTFDPVNEGTIVSTLAPHQGVVDEMRNEGHYVDKWRHVQRGSYTDHDIPQAKRAKIAVMPNFSLVKFVSFPDKILIGENTHHAYLLNEAFGTIRYPSGAIAIGRAWIQENELTGIAFDSGAPKVQERAIKQVKEWAEEEGYSISPALDEPIIGISGIL